MATMQAQTNGAKCRTENALIAIGVVGTIATLAGIVAAVAIGITAEITRPAPLLTPISASEKRLIEQEAKAKIAKVPGQIIAGTVRIEPWRGDGANLHPKLEQAALSWGGYRLSPPGPARTVEYAVPESTATWLASLDASNGKNAYAALNEPPATRPGAGGELTKVTVQRKPKIVQRQTPRRWIEIAAATSAAGLVTILLSGLTLAYMAKPQPTERAGPATD